MTPDRLVREPAQVNADIATLLDELEGSVAAASETELAEANIMAHLLARGISEERTADNLLKGLFARHWREHLGQIRELRDALGM